MVQQQKDELKIKLSESVDYRRKILADPPEPIYKIFGFYFVDPDLVSMFLFFVCYIFTVNKIIVSIFSIDSLRFRTVVQRY